MKKTCEICGGSGQTSYFKGVSRFLLSVEECAVCNGVGYTIVEDDKKKEKKKRRRKLGSKKNNKASLS
jgi:DnaJ-class molecular chaperone